MPMPTLGYRIVAILLAIIALNPSALADEFTSPSNSEPDLAVHYTLGETVTIAWTTSLQYLSLYVSIWGGEDIGALLSEYIKPQMTEPIPPPSLSTSFTYQGKLTNIQPTQS